MQDQLIRNIQIDLILENQNPIIDAFNGIWNDLSVIEVDVYHREGGELIYYNTNRKWIFLRDDRKNRFWVNHDAYWSIFQFKFKLTYKQIQDLTKTLVDESLNNCMGIPDAYNFKEATKVEETLNDCMAMPNLTFSNVTETVEETLNNSVAIPIEKVFNGKKIEDAFNKEYEKSKI